MNETGDNITIFFNEKNEKNEDNYDNDYIKKMMDEITKEVDERSVYLTDNTVNTVYTVKELLKICSYYGIDKSIKKYKKQDIIATICYFESLPENDIIVQKRYMMWKNIYELLNDPIMKKYIIWQ